MQSENPQAGMTCTQSIAPYHTRVKGCETESLGPGDVYGWPVVMAILLVTSWAIQLVRAMDQRGGRQTSDSRLG